MPMLPGRSESDEKLGERARDAKLLARLLATACSRAEALLQRFGGLDGVFSADPCQLLRVPGVGPAKISQLQAVREIAQRLRACEKITSEPIHTSQQAYHLFSHIAWEDQEVVVAAFLDSRNRLIGRREIFRGTLHGAPARPREILREALRANAAQILLAHNHPSQDPEPSEDDARLTVHLEWAASEVGVPLVDHLVVCGGGRYFSFAQAKLLGMKNHPVRETVPDLV